MELVEALKKNPFVLAPMAGITDSAFRSFMKEMGAGIVVTELISAHGIQYGSQTTLNMLKYEEDQRPLGIQLFGESPEITADAAKYVESLGADFVDLNFGCPVNKVVKKGAGSAMLKDLVGMQKMLRSVKAAISIPLTIKIRTGWDESQRNAHQVTQLAYDEGITWVAIHGRTRSQGYSGWADWDFIRDVKSKSPLPIIGNGDIHSADEAIERLETSGCDGVMIGRGCLKNPWIFLESSRRLNKIETQINSSKNFNEVFDRLHHYLSKNESDHINLLQLKKFASWYSAGYPGASSFRKKLFDISTVEDIRKTIDEYFNEADTHKRASQKNEAFLMGGHG